LLVRDELAVLYYIPNADQVGFRSIGHLSGLDLDETTRFSISHLQADDVIVSSDSVIRLSDALQGAREFFRSQGLPESVEWSAL
jgi:hypothetical protein